MTSLRNNPLKIDRPDLKIKERGNDFCILKNDDTNGANTSVGTSGMVLGTGDFAYFLTHFAQGWISQIHWINNKEQFLQAIQTSNMPEYRLFIKFFFFVLMAFRD